MAEIDNPTHLSRVDGNYTEVVTDDTVRNGIDDDTTNDAEKGAALGGIGGAAVGLAAGAVAGPVGAIVGAVIGGVAGAAASGAAVAAVDRVDNDNTISGVGSDTTTDTVYDETTVDRPYTTTGVLDTTGYNPNGTIAPVAPAGATGYNTVPGEDGASIKTGGYANDGTPDTRGVGEKFVDAITGDDVDDKTGKVVNHDSVLHGTDSTGRVNDAGYTSGTVNDTAYVSGAGTTATAYTTPGAVTTGAISDTANDVDTNTGVNRMQTLGENVPSIKTGGYANDGTPDTRGVGEKVADAVTGDTVDDKTGKVVNHS